MGYPESMYRFSFSSPQDSVPSSKEIYNYELWRNLTLKETYLYDSFNGGNWLNGLRNSYSYTNNKLVTHTISQKVNYTNIWDYTQKWEYTYHLSGGVYLKVLYKWDDTAQWVYYTKEVSYGSGNKHFYVNFKWNVAQQSWFYLDSTVWIYDTFSRPIERYTFNWDINTGNWINYKKEENSYQTSPRLTTNIWYFWNTTYGWKKTSKFLQYLKSNSRDSIFYVLEGKSDNTGWDTIEKYTYYYDYKNLLIFEYDFEKDNLTNEWFNLDKYEIRYDTNGNQCYSTTFSWSTQNGWVGINHYTRDFDNRNNEIKRIVFDWNYTLKDWDTINREDNIFDTANNKLATVFYKYDKYLYQFVLTGKNWYFYPDSIVSTLESEKFELSLYPNPVTDYLYLNFTNLHSSSHVSFFDQNGRLILYIPVSKGSNTIDVSRLKSGHYLLEVPDGKHVYSGRIIKY
jgi:hypothetical protein